MGTNLKSEPSGVQVKLQEAADKVVSGIRDPEAMKEAIESLNNLRERIRQREGLLDIVIPAIRELRE